MTYEEIFHKFQEKYPAYNSIIYDYRQAKVGYGITIWFKNQTNNSIYYINVKYDLKTDNFILLDINESWFN